MVNFQTQTSQFGKILESIAMYGIWYGHFVYLRPNGIFYGHLVHFVVIWYIFPVLVCCTEENMATLTGKSSLS
jgi:hypothetical protein